MAILLSRNSMSAPPFRENGFGNGFRESAVPEAKGSSPINARQSLARPFWDALPGRRVHIAATFIVKHGAMTIIRWRIFPADNHALLDIWRKYIATPSVSLDYQGNEAEFATLPGKYAPPQGCVLVADNDVEIDGCIAYRQVGPGLCEIKRLYVRPRARGTQLGQDLVGQLILEARKAGHVEMRLDVLEEFTSARRLYEAFGFVPAKPVTYNPIPGTAFLGLPL